MKLNELLDGVALAARHVQDVECSGICCDTRDMTPAASLWRFRGTRPMDTGTSGRPWNGERRRCSASAPRRGGPLAGDGGHPGRPGHRLSQLVRPSGPELTLLAVTGTNGKTTTTYLLKAMLEGCLHTQRWG